MIFSKKILAWYAENKRDLPWRNTVNPYNIWLSEIMLQQTRVAQGTPYYLKFIKIFPSVNDLANASEEKILKLWQGLGYYSRARNLHATAKLVSEKYNGNFPNSYNELLQLKGVGDYTASAIASISFDIPEPVVDGNVYRVLSRYFGVTLPINSSDGIKYFKELARKVMDTDHIRDYNQGIMEFGAIQCTPKNPSCNDCPLNSSCVALKEKKVGELPVKLKKLKIKNRYFNYLVIIDEHNRTVLQQRIGKGIWQHLYEFPLIELDQDIPLDKSEIDKRLKKLLIFDEEYEVYPLNENKIIHKLSHQHLYTTFWVLNVVGNIPDGIKVSEIGKYPVPVLIADFIKTFKF
tara:strand:+ start:21070 stop:22113 length:1044 start_codon:yes stop_codon:yes gene_type:complete